jgi:hypothetical protein
MKYVFIVAAVLTVLLLAASAMYWVLYGSTGEEVARGRAVGLFRFAVVIVLGTFNIWIFGRVGGAIKDIWFPTLAPPAVVKPLDDAASAPEGTPEAASDAASEPSR